MQKEERTMEERAIIENADDNDNVQELLIMQRHGSEAGPIQHSSSYLSVFKIKEVKLVIIAGGLKVMANFISFNDIGLTENISNLNDNFYLFFYGGLFALFVSGVTHDTVFNGKSYLMIVILNLVGIVY